MNIVVENEDYLQRIDKYLSDYLDESRSTIVKMMDSEFILVNGKYQADEGCHDDLVMSLAVAFAPFCNVKNFTEIKKLIKALYTKDSEADTDFTDFLTIGSFDDFVDSQTLSSFDQF